MDEIIEALAKHDKTAVAKALQSGAADVWQLVFNKGHKTATDAAKGERQELEGKLTDVQAQVGTLEGQLAEAQEAAKQVETVRTEMTKQIEDLNAAHATEVTTLKGKHQTATRERTMSDLKSKLIASAVDPDYAAVLVERADTQKRFNFNEDGGFDVFQQDGTNVYLTTNGDVLDQFVNDLKTAVPAKFITVEGDRGSDTGGAGGSGNGSGGGTGGNPPANDADFLGQYRKDIAASREAQKTQSVNLVERMQSI